MTNSNVQKKDFTAALLLWLFLGSVGGHRIYIKGSAWPLLWYFTAVIFSLSIILWVDLFRLKTMIEQRHMEDQMKEQYLRNMYSKN